MPFGIVTYSHELGARAEEGGWHTSLGNIPGVVAWSAAQELSLKERPLQTGDFSIKIHKGDYRQRIADLEVLIFAHNDPERLARGDELSEAIRQRIIDRYLRSVSQIDLPGGIYGPPHESLTCAVAVHLAPMAYSAGSAES